MLPCLVKTDSTDTVCSSPQEETAENTSCYIAADNTHMYSHTVRVLCTHTISFIKPWENMLPSLLNIDVRSGIKWVNKSWNTDNTTLREIESMWTFAMCDVWMLPQRVRVQGRERDAIRKWEALHGNISGGLSKWKTYLGSGTPEDMAVPFRALMIVDSEYTPLCSFNVVHECYILMDR